MILRIAERGFLLFRGVGGWRSGYSSWASWGESPSHPPFSPGVGLAWVGGGWVGWCGVFPLSPLFGWLAPFGGFGVSGSGSPNPPNFPHGSRVLAVKTLRNGGLARGPQGTLGASRSSHRGRCLRSTFFWSAWGSHALGHALGFAHALGCLSASRELLSAFWFRFSRGTCVPLELMRYGHSLLMPRVSG